MDVRMVLSLLFTLMTVTESAKILFQATLASPSIFNIYTPIIEALHERKHDLTVQIIYQLKKTLPGVKVIPITPPPFGSDEEFSKNLIWQLTEAGPIKEVYRLLSLNEQGCTEYFEDEGTKTLLAGGKQFDVVISDGFSECILAAGAMLGKHVVNLIPSPNLSWQYSDAPLPPSYVSNYYRHVTNTHMTFWQRMTNAIDYTAFRLIGELILKPSTNKMVAKYLPHAPSMDEIRDRQIAFDLNYADPVLYNLRPSMPTIISVGGLHCRDANPLPKGLNDFVESSGEDGFIMFGLGTNMKSKFLPIETRDAILSALSRLKQKVIWKFEAELDNIPENVKIVKFMPQQDLLGHPKIRLFITHAGLLSLQEVLYHGVPVIGMPFFMDQSGNIGRIQQLGIGEYLNFLNVTADGLYDLINKVLTNPSYRKNAKKYSAIFRDLPMKAIDRAMFWIEYVVRHDGMSHFRPASRDLNFFQYFLLDIVAFLLTVATVAIGLFVFSVKLLLKKLFPKKGPSSSIQKKTK